MIRQKGEESGLTLTPNYNTTRGFFIQINTAGNENLAEALPPYFIKVVKSKNVINCTTEDLVMLSFFVEPYTAQKMKFSVKDFFSKCDQSNH